MWQRKGARQGEVLFRMELTIRQLALDYEDIWSISSAEQHLSGRDTHFQTKLNIMRAHIPKQAPIQSTFPDLSTDDSRGNANHKAVKRPAPRIALDKSQYRSGHQWPPSTNIEKKNHLHSANSIKTPMKNAPSAPPMGHPNPKKPRAKFLILPGGKVIPMMATIFGITNAAPTPAKALAIAKVTRLRVQKPLITDQRTHQAPPRFTIFLCP
jgi:hypothetical protein